MTFSGLRCLFEAGKPGKQLLGSTNLPVNRLQEASRSFKLCVRFSLIQSSNIRFEEKHPNCVNRTWRNLQWNSTKKHWKCVDPRPHHKLWRAALKRVAPFSPAAKGSTSPPSRRNSCQLWQLETPQLHTYCKFLRDFNSAQGLSPLSTRLYSWRPFTPLL